MPEIGPIPPSRTLLADLDRFLLEEAARRERATAAEREAETVIEALDAQILAGLVHP